MDFWAQIFATASRMYNTYFNGSIDHVAVDWSIVTCHIHFPALIPNSTFPPLQVDVSHLGGEYGKFWWMGCMKLVQIFEEKKTMKMTMKSARFVCFSTCCCRFSLPFRSSLVYCCVHRLSPPSIALLSSLSSFFSINRSNLFFHHHLLYSSLFVNIVTAIIVVTPSSLC